MDAVGMIGDEILRRHYKADLLRRLSAFFGEERSVEPRPEGGQRFSPSEKRQRRFRPSGPRVGLAEAPLPSQHKLGRKSREPAREVMILAIALGHPTLLEAHWEELAALDFSGKRLAVFRDALIAAPSEALQSPETLVEALSAAGQAEERERILALAARMPVWWSIRADAAPSDAERVLRQNLLLQHRGALNRELKLAEQSLAAEANEQNFARLQDIKAHLADLAHAEAAIDGFGEQSGRPSSSL
jgi:DNA primase